MFKDTEEGKTHSFNDNCGEPAHNNQCDGCKAGIPLEGDWHIKDGKIVMYCQREKYEGDK